MRGKAIQPERDCEFCSKPLPRLRHWEMRFCSVVCRQRNRYNQEHVGKGIPCLDCGKIFARVGSHVVQVHGYESVGEYRREHGLMAHETRIEEHAELMREKQQSHTRTNLTKGKRTQYTEGDDHAEKLKEFWENRRKKAEYKKLNSNLRGNIKL